MLGVKTELQEKCAFFCTDDNFSKSMGFDYNAGTSVSDKPSLEKNHHSETLLHLVLVFLVLQLKLN